MHAISGSTVMHIAIGYWQKANAVYFMRPDDSQRHRNCAMQTAELEEDLFLETVACSNYDRGCIVIGKSSYYVPILPEYVFLLSRF